MKRNFFHRYLSAKVLPIWTILLIDVFIIVISSLLAYALRYDFRSIFLESSTIDKTILWTVVVNLIFFRVFRTYSNVLRFSSFVDIMRIFVSLTVSYALLMITSVLTESYLEFNLAPVSVLFMSYIISFAMMACSRVIVKTFFEALNFDGTHSANVFIYGAKEAGVNIAKALRVNLRNHYRLRGFIADEPELINKVMMGVKVFPNDDTLIDVLNDRDVQTIIISPAKMEELKKSDMADRLLVHNIKLMTAPPLSEWNGQALSRTQLKEIQIEDLLQRNPIEIDIHKVASHLEGKRVMITGAAGSIGSEIMRQVASFTPYKLIFCGPGRDPSARHPSGTSGPLARHRCRDHHSRHLQCHAHGGYLQGVQAPVYFPCGRLQACADDGGQRFRVHPGERIRHAHRCRSCREIRCREVCDDFYGQGC